MCNMCGHNRASPCGSVRVRTLQYKGDCVVYIGEGRGGVNGSPSFFSMLEVEWTCQHVEPLAPFPECYEKMYVMRRRAQLGSD